MDKFVISCDICMDLIPLVQDGIASEDSRKSVEQHINNCEACRALYGEVPMETPLTVDVSRAFEKVQKQIRIFSAVLMMFGIFFGLGLTASSEMFYNSLIMPAIGALGYVIFRWKALYKVPILLLISYGVINLFGFMLGREYLDVFSVLVWTLIYSMFVLVGIVITWLLHFAFKRD